MTAPHLIPIWDVVQHDPSPDCICGPTFTERTPPAHLPRFWQHHAAVAHHSSRGNKSFRLVTEVREEAP